MVRVFSPINTDDKQLERVITEVGKQFDSMKISISGGNFITAIPISTGPTILYHKLGRAVQGFIVTRLNVAAFIYEPDRNVDLTQVIKLQASMAAVCDIYFF